MSRTNHRSKWPGYEYWAHRYVVGWSPNSANKRLNARAERRRARYVLRVEPERAQGFRELVPVRGAA